jgi:AAA domain (Cdc48 subfamily)
MICRSPAPTFPPLLDILTGSCGNPRGIQSLWQLLLGILEKATLMLGDNRRVDLSQTIIFMTSNLGGGEITELMIGGMGLALSVSPESKPHLDEKVEKTGAGAAKRKFAPDRIDKTVVFHPLRSGPARTNPRNRIGNGPAAGAGDGEGTLYVRTIPTNAEGG